MRITQRDRSIDPSLLVDGLHEHSSRGRDADGVEELRMPQGQLDQLPDLCQLALAAADIIVTDLV